MVYETDSAAISEAREEVADAEFEIEVANKEKQISLIEKEIELLEKQKENVEDYYAKMIEQQEKLIESIEKQKSKWEELSEVREVAEAYSAIEQVFGDLGYSVEEVLNGSTGAFEDFKSKYLTILSEMDSNSSFGEGLNYAIGELNNSLATIGSDTTSIDNLTSKIGEVEGSVTSVANAISGLGSSTGASGDKGEEPGSTGGNTSSLQGAIQAQTEAALDEKAGIPAQKTAWEELNVPLGEADRLVLSIKDNLEAMNGKEFTVTLNVNGGGGFDFNSITGKFNGTANVSGTANLQGNWGLKEDTRSLVGELGREIVVRNDKFFTVGNNGAEFVNLKRGDIIFNHRQTEDLLKNGKINTRGKAFANGTALNPVSTIQGIDIKSLQDKFLGKLDNIIVPVNSIDRNIESMVRVGNNIHTNNASQDINISIGDIQLHGVQDVNGLANAISTKLPNMLLQTITKR